MGPSSWEKEMNARQEEAEKNECRELVEVTGGSDWNLRRLMNELPGFVWKYSERLTVPGYVLRIAEQLEKEFGRFESIPIDLYPCEYFRIMKHSMPTEMALQPKRFDGAKVKLREKLQKYYEHQQDSSFLIPDEQLIPRMACAVQIDEMWYRGKVENVPQLGNWVYVYLVDDGVSRQVTKADLRRLALRFGHYPPMVVRAGIRGALIQRMDCGKIERFHALLQNLGHLARCQITTSTEPFQIVMCHPTYEFQNICSFLLAPPRGQPSVEGVWLPKQIARELDRKNGVERREHDDSGADSEDDEDDEDDGWDFEVDRFVRSLPPAQKIFRLNGEELEVERVENERTIYLTNRSMRETRKEIEEVLEQNRESLEPLPDEWIAFGTACALRHDGVSKRAVIVGIQENELDLLLADFGTTTKASKSEVYSLPNEEILTLEPQVTLVSLTDFKSIHFSRVEILRRLLPRGTSIEFTRDRKSKEIPTNGSIYLANGTSVAEIVLEETSKKNMDLECFALLPFSSSYDILSHRVNRDFSYKSRSSIIYKKSKLVKSQF